MRLNNGMLGFSKEISEYQTEMEKKKVHLIASRSVSWCAFYRDLHGFTCLTCARGAFAEWKWLSAKWPSQCARASVRWYRCCSPWEGIFVRFSESLWAIVIKNTGWISIVGLLPLWHGVEVEAASAQGNGHAACDDLGLLFMRCSRSMGMWWNFVFSF